MEMPHILGVIYMTVISFGGSIFNGMVIIVLVKNISTITVPNVFILSICTSGFLACSMAIPLAIWSVTVGKWNDVSCQTHAFFIYLFGMVSMVHMGAIAMEKYLTIVKYTNTAGHFLSLKQSVIVVVILWVYSIFLSTLPLVGWARYGPEAANVTCSLKWDQRSASDLAYFVIMFLGCFLLPVGVMSFSYYRIFKVRRKVSVSRSNCILNLSDHAKAELKKEINTAIQLLILIFGYLLAWTPYSIVVILIISGAPQTASVWLLMSSLFAKASFMYNPVLYAFISRQFRRKFVRTFCCGISINRVGSG
ncbi:visual pigment-like receptor peropsin [Actinia tenebrosa]|uniref:Visual pigment-like receptor peropsin n=1 Tax=Actinia tenebrosa TaxID=6105 RepID=A0A6P8JDB9_ACTTE|nr:visual pigment-like receptor peropsin [Actinia tenebrosa]XP_031574510.1 visual pigment-like receptor peropsin [Actinia tenebrosa]